MELPGQTRGVDWGEVLMPVPAGEASCAEDFSCGGVSSSRGWKRLPRRARCSILTRAVLGLVVAREFLSPKG